MVLETRRPRRVPCPNGADGAAPSIDQPLSKPGGRRAVAAKTGFRGRENLSYPSKFFSAAMYFSCVRAMTSAGSAGAGGFWSHFRRRR